MCRLPDALCLGAAPEKGIAANPFCAKAYGPLVRLRDGLAHNDAEAVPAEVKSLLGLGIGLTPSADDVLCGMTYTLLHGRAEADRGGCGVCERSEALCPGTYKPHKRGDPESRHGRRQI